MDWVTTLRVGNKREKCEKRPCADGRRCSFYQGQVRVQKTKARARAIEKAKGMARTQGCPKMVKEREPRNFVGRSGEPSEGQRVEPGDTNVPTGHRNMSMHSLFL